MRQIASYGGHAFLARTIETDEPCPQQEHRARADGTQGPSRRRFPLPVPRQGSPRPTRYRPPALSHGGLRAWLLLAWSRLPAGDAPARQCRVLEREGRSQQGARRGGPRSIGAGRLVGGDDLAVRIETGLGA